MESFLLDDVGSMIRNEDIERLISPMTVQLCHLIISTERNDLGSEAFASLEKTAEELAQASDEFVQVAKRLARDSEEEWLQVEVGPVADSLMTSGRNITLVAQKLHLQPECQSHREELVTTAQQILLGTMKVLLLEDAAAARTMARAAGRCLTCLDALESADTRSPRGPWADLAGALLHLGRLGARGSPGRLLRDRVPALLASARAHPQSRRRLLALAREALGELLAQLEPGPLAPPAPARGALTRQLRQLQALLAAPGPELLRGRLDALLAAVLGPCMRLAAGAPPRERLRLVARCRRLLELRGLEPREPGEERVSLRAATEALSQGVRAGLLRQILGTFTDMHSPLQRLVQAASATTPVSSRCDGEAVPKSLQLLFADFQHQATQMLRVAHLVLLCCPGQQTGRDLEATMAGLWGLVVTVQQLFSQGRQGAHLDWSPAALQALLQAWTRASERLLACFDGVLYIPEFLSVSVEEMAKHVNFFTWALRSGDGGGFSKLVAYLQGRATHIVQVMSRFVDQDRDPIFRNGLRVLIWQLDQASLVLGVATERCAGGHQARNTEACLTAAKHLICAAQSLREGLDGTNHPDLLSPLREPVRMFDMANRQPYSLLPSRQDTPAPERKAQRLGGLGKSDPGTSYPPRDHLSSSLVPDTCPRRWGPQLPATSKCTLTVESGGHQAVTSAGTNLQVQSTAVDIAQESLAGEGPLEPERLTGLQEMLTPAPSVTDLAGEMAQCTTAAASGHLEVSLRLSERSRDTRQCLVAMAGDWYPLCQQLFCYSPAADLPGSTAVFMELQQNLVSMVQLAAKSGPMDLGESDPDSTRHPEALSQMQGQLEAVESHAKQLLDKVWASDGLHAPRLWEESLKDRCLLWSVAVRDLLQCIESLSRRQGLFLLSLQQAVKGQQGLQEALAQMAEVSWRLQEAARLSCLLCGDEQVRAELSFLCREVHVLTDALRDVAQPLASSPRPSPSLSTRFQLLCLELTLRAKALTGHLSSINADYGQALQDAFYPRFSVCKDPQTEGPRHPGPEISLQRMVSGIQAVQEMVAGGQGSGSCPTGLPLALESILVLTKEVAQRVPVLQEYPEEGGMHMLDWLQWEWAAKAHHAVAQLQAWQGGHTKAYRLLAGCLKLSDGQDFAQPQLHCREGASDVAAAGSVDSQGAAPRDPPGNSAGTCTAGPDGPRTTAADLDLNRHVLLCRTAEVEVLGSPQVGHSEGPEFLPEDTVVPFFQHRPCSSPTKPPSCPAWPLTELDQPLTEDGSADSGDRITQMTRQMAQDVFLMAQSLSSRGRSLTKEELIASARKVAMLGQRFARLLHVVAESCTDARCLQELLCALEQVQTTSNQLHIISSVKASLARSKSSEELLVGNAQQVLHAVGKTMRAAEAASLRGLRHQCPDPEELDVAALCMQWRQKLLRHRLRETQNLDSCELGLQKTSADTAPSTQGPGAPVPEVCSEDLLQWHCQSFSTTFLSGSQQRDCQHHLPDT